MWTTIFGWRFDWQEFVLGLLAGLVLTFILTRLWPFLPRLIVWMRERARTFSETFTAGATDRYRLELVARLESFHLARALFGLDEILIPPRLLPPPSPVDPLKAEPGLEYALAGLPNLPDVTALSGIYGAPTISLPHALADGANLLVTGELGTGKSIALAYLAGCVARREPDLGKLAEVLPVLVHAGELRIDKRSAKDLLEPVVAATQAVASPNLAPRLPSYLRQHFHQGNVLLLLDGLDELGSGEMSAVVTWLAKLLAGFPGLRVVAAGPAREYDGLVRLGLVPVPVAPWTEHKQRVFLSRWSLAWQKYASAHLPKRNLGEPDPTLITGWLTGTTRCLTPLELTLRAWAAFAGDIRGPRTIDSLDAYLARFLSPDELPPAELAGLAWIRERSSAVPEKNLRRGAIVDDLIEAGILVHRPGARVAFCHPSIGAYLGARAMASAGLGKDTTGLGWLPAETAVIHFAALGDIKDTAQQYLGVKDDPLEIHLLACSRWLKDSPGKAPWRAELLRALAVVIQDARRPYGLRLRAVHMLARSSEPSVGILFRRLLTSQDLSSRMLAALGAGSIKDGDAVPALIKMASHDKEMPARQAACLGLASIGLEPALEGLGRLLLQGSEDVRLAAAEALACHPDEGYSMLREAAEYPDSQTRRAAVFGLARVPEDWAAAALEKIMVEDKQWVVRGAAAEAVDRRRNPPWKIAWRPKDVADLQWLISFAGKQGLGVAPGKAALEMLRRALSTGTTQEKAAALEAIGWYGTRDLRLELEQALGSPEAVVRDTAFEALWRMRAPGEKAPVAALAK